MIVSPIVDFFDAHDWLCEHGLSYPLAIMVGNKFMFHLNPWDQNISGFFDTFVIENIEVFKIHYNKQALQLAA